MSIPAIIVIILYSVNLLYSASLHGKIREDNKHNFWVSFIGTIIIVVLLHLGGFFS